MSLSFLDERGRVDSHRRTALIAVSCGDTSAALAEAFRSDSWKVLDWLTAGHRGAAAGGAFDNVDCVVFDPGFVCYNPAHGEHVVKDGAGALLADLVATASPALRGRAEGGAAVVALSSRDALGSASRISRSAAAAGVIAAGRGLALLYAARGVSVNVVCALASPQPTDNPAARALLPEPVSLSDVIHATMFFADPRTRYITGQTLHVCGGATLLSSLSV
jgi:NAD(P)-dependent dehydrogenase (short-subunit alcohol dehydrogenase family)